MQLNLYIKLRDHPTIARAFKERSNKKDSFNRWTIKNNVSVYFTDAEIED